MMAPIFGLRIVESPHMTEAFEDWSGVRSRARAERRRKRGFPQRVVIRSRPQKVIYQVGDTLVMHPETARALGARGAREPDRGGASGRTLAPAVEGSEGSRAFTINPQNV